MYKRGLDGEVKQGQNYAKVAGFGAVGGFVATWAVTILLVLSEIEIGFPEGTFYAVIGMVLGTEGVNAVYIGFGLHLLTGTVIGIVSAVLITFIRLSYLTCIYRYVGLGLVVGFVAWLVLFLPITLFGVNPTMQEIITSVSTSTHRIVLAEEINQMITTILLSAIAYHLVYGAIFGYVTASLSRKKAVKVDKAVEDVS